MSFQREGDPLDVAARAAATQIRGEIAARGLSEKISLPENTTDWDTIFCAEANLIRAMADPDLRRNAAVIYNRYADVAGAEKAAQRAANAIDVTQCDTELLRADLVAVHNETARIYLLGYQVERQRADLARFVMYIGFGALWMFIGFISTPFIGLEPNPMKRAAAVVVLAAPPLFAIGRWLFNKWRAGKRRTSATAMGLLLAVMTLLPAQQLIARQLVAQQTPPAAAATTSTATTSAAKPSPSKTSAAPTPVRIPIAPLIILTGVLGACFSVLQRVQRTWTGDPLVALLNLRNARSHVFLSIITGAIASLVMFAIFAGGMISGSLFPTIVNASEPAGGKGHMLLVYAFLSSTGPATFADYGRLLVWAFIAGFAERFVPDILDRFVSSTKKE